MWPSPFFAAPKPHFDTIASVLPFVRPTIVPVNQTSPLSSLSFCDTSCLPTTACKRGSSTTPRYHAHLRVLTWCERIRAYRHITRTTLPFFFPFILWVPNPVTKTPLTLSHSTIIVAPTEATAAVKQQQQKKKNQQSSGSSSSSRRSR